VQSAWRIFPNDIDLSDAQTPIDLLGALVKRFGVDFSFEGKEVRFLDQLELPASQVKYMNEFRIPSNRPDLFFSWSWTVKPDGGVHLGLGYCMDLTKYRDYLKRNRALR
jgi:hypothetical protein